MIRGIIVIEGADAAGKSTLAQQLVDQYGARYVHNGLSKRMWTYHLGRLRAICKLAETQLVVVDRLWLSEQVYGQVFRGGPAYDTGARCLDRILLKHAAVNVICVRDDQARHLTHFKILKTQRPEKFDNIARVVQLYADLKHGNVAHPGDTYLDQNVRYGDYAKRPDVVCYDMDVEGRDLKRVAIRIVGRLGSLRKTQYEPALSHKHQNVLGHATMAKYLFVGETCSPTTRPSWPRWPFVSPDSVINSASWLNAMLHKLAFDETQAMWTNAWEADEHLKELVRLPSLKLIALGGRAAMKLSKLGITYFIKLPHPQWARRFQHNAPQLYLEKLKEALS